LYPIATKRQNRAVICVNGYLHIDLAVGIGQQKTDVCVEVEQRGRPVNVLIDGRVKGRGHLDEATEDRHHRRRISATVIRFVLPEAIRQASMSTRRASLLNC
jgi:hypothetical protein